MRALSDSGDPITWWFAYKMPEATYGCSSDPASYKPAPKDRIGADQNDGYRYLYYEPGGKLALSPNSLAPGGSPGAITRTLLQLWNPDKPSSNIAWIAYNDEAPKSEDIADAGGSGTGYDTNSSSWGHNKGVLAVDLVQKTGFWLLHSYPRWPVQGQSTFPSSKENDRLRYAQTFICMSIGDLETIENIAGMLRGYHEPQIIHSNMPSGAADALPTLAALISENSRSDSTKGPPINRSTSAGELTIQASCKGQPKVTFRLFAKGPRWAKDFWSDLVSHRLGVNLDVETWRRVTKTDPIAPTTDEEGHSVSDGYALFAADLGWYFRESEDHGKWAVGQPTDSDIAAVGDINRQVSQEKRGGGAVVVEDATLAAALRSMLVLLPTDEEPAGTQPADDGTLAGPATVEAQPSA